MKVTIENTPKGVDVRDTEQLRMYVPYASIWKGTTEKGTPIEMLVLTIKAQPGHDKALQAELAQDLSVRSFKT